MFSIFDSGLNRREFLRIGSLALGGLSLPGLLAAQAAGRKMVRDRSVVLLFLQGGPPQVETFDPKPDAPANTRSATGQVQTRLPGIQFGGTFPKMAALADRLAVVRSFGSGFGNHEQGPVLTGNNPLEAPMGSLYARLAGSLHPRSGMPTNTLVLPESIDPAIKLNEPTGPFTYNYVVKNYIPAGKLGAGYDAFLASGGSQLMSNLRLQLPRQQFDDRRQLLGQLDSFQRQLDRTRELSGLDAFQQQAYDVLLRGVSQAFDLSKEDPKTIERYDTSHLFRMEDYHKGGSKSNNWRNLSRTTNLLGKQMLLARRLCEAGCGFVTVVDSCWDFHGDGNNPPIPVGVPLLGPQLDHAVAAFLEDVHERGLDDKILLVITGEMGRTPQKNSKNGGTGHWKDLTPLVLAGGGLRMGQVIGKSDSQGGKPASERYGPEHLLATVMQTLFDPTEVRVAPKVPPNVGKLITDTKPIAVLF
jgi:hypothetical protein